MKMVLKELTKDTPDIADSLTKPTTSVSARPTNITRSCYRKNGVIKLFKLRSENISTYPDYC